MPCMPILHQKRLKSERLKLFKKKKKKLIKTFKHKIILDVKHQNQRIIITRKTSISISKDSWQTRK